MNMNKILVLLVEIMNNWPYKDSILRFLHPSIYINLSNTRNLHDENRNIVFGPYMDGKK